MEPVRLDAAVDAILPEVVAFRHRLHRIPEIAGAEVETSAALREALAPLGLEMRPPLLGTDVVGVLTGARPGRQVALRADIDALPVTEENPVEYASRHPGFMHACGHDGHMAMLYGAALVLSRLRDELAGAVRFIFQPGEEVVAMGRKLVEAGVLEHPRVDVAAALHGWPGLPEGVIATRSGAIMASAAHFHLRLTGRGGHGSAPELTVDPIYAGALVVTALQGIVGRNVDPQDAAVVSICRFESGNTSNVIPETADLYGTTRALSDDVDRLLEKRLREVIAGVCVATGVTFELDYRPDYRVTCNDPETVEFAAGVAERYLGKGAFRRLERSAMAAEDFGYYLMRCPGVFARIGTGEDKVGLHHPRYDFGDGALRNGVRFLAAFALEAGRR